MARVLARGGNANRGTRLGPAATQPTAGAEAGAAAAPDHSKRRWEGSRWRRGRGSPSTERRHNQSNPEKKTWGALCPS